MFYLKIGHLRNFYLSTLSTSTGIDSYFAGIVSQ